MSTIAPVVAAGKQLADALRTIPELRVDLGHGRLVVPPAAVVSPPSLFWEGYCEGQPRSATWSVYLIAVATEFATTQLLELVPVAAAAIEDHTDAVVTRAVPGGYPASPGSADLPAYQLTVEMEL